MPPSLPPRIAVIADAHFHDLYGDYGLKDRDSAACGMAVRRLAESARSTRLFNESHAALRYALNDIAARGIEHVVLLGDYSDDGQRATLAGLRRVLDHYATTFSMRFYATVGNHDIFGPDGRHRSKRFLNDEGGYDVVTSDPDFSDVEAGRVILSDAMYCPGYPAGLLALPEAGFFGAPQDHHWETPFGIKTSVEDRRYPVVSSAGKSHRPLIDASYLTEPFPGVWLMMIDANVFKPIPQDERGQHHGEFADSTEAGWNAMLTHKAFILDWMKSVAARADKLGKRLLAFSHYPVLDPLDGTRADELSLQGPTGLTQRLPDPAVAEAIVETGVKVHFSGHLHVNDTARYRTAGGFLVNISVPSLVAYPGAYKIVDISDARLEVETVGIGDMSLDPRITQHYQREVSQTGLKAGRLLACPDYGAFLYEHIGHLVSRRHLRREWPEDLAALIRTLTLADLAAIALEDAPIAAADVQARPELLRTPTHRERIARIEKSAALPAGALTGLPALAFLEDWYRLKMGSDIALAALPADRLAAYRLVAGLYAARIHPDPPGVRERFAILFRMFSKYLSGLPSQDFSVDLRTGDVRPRRP